MKKTSILSAIVLAVAFASCTDEPDITRSVLMGCKWENVTQTSSQTETYTLVFTSETSGEFQSVIKKQNNTKKETSPFMYVLDGEQGILAVQKWVAEIGDSTYDYSTFKLNGTMDTLTWNYLAKVLPMHKVKQ